MTPAAALAAILLLLPATARAADEDWRAEWDKTVAAANKEGTVVLMVPPNTGQRNFLNREWPKTFPNIKLSLTVQEAAQWIQRVRVERGAGQYLWDAAMSGSVATFTVKNDGFVDPMVPEFILPDVKDAAAWGGWDHVFYDNERKYVFGTRSFLKLPYYNAKLLSPEKVKRMGSAIFLDPELKGKIVWTDPLVPSAGESFAPVMRRILGDDGLRKFVAEQVVFSSNLPDLVDRMARGQYVICMGPIIGGFLEPYKKAGLDLDIRPLGNTPEFAAYSNTGGSNTVLIKNRPHPNAMRVFLNWVLSKPIAAALSRENGEDSARVDVPSQADPAEQRVPGITYMEPQREELASELRAAQEIIRQARRQQ